MQRRSSFSTVPHQDRTSALGIPIASSRRSRLLSRTLMVFRPTLTGGRTHLHHDARSRELLALPSECGSRHTGWPAYSASALRLALGENARFNFYQQHMLTGVGESFEIGLCYVQQQPQYLVQITPHMEARHHARRCCKSKDHSVYIINLPVVFQGAFNQVSHY